MQIFRRFYLLVMPLALGGCVSTQMQGYADRDLPSRPLSHVVAIVNAPISVTDSIQTAIADEATKLGVVAEDARIMFPPTRQYSQSEIKNDLIADKVDGLLVVNVGDSGVVKEYAGTLMSGSSNSSTYGGGSMDAFGTISINSTTNGFSSAVSRPFYRHTRQTDFEARLFDPKTGRVLWIGHGQVNAQGRFFVGSGTSASNVAKAIWGDMQTKGVIFGLK